MESEYLTTVKPYGEGSKGKRGVDLFTKLLAGLVLSMEETRDEIKDVLGDLFVGAISYGEGGQYFTPEHLCRLMARLTVSEDASEQSEKRRRVCDPCCGAGRLLLAAAEIDRHWEFVGQDIDLRCVRMTAINLALRNLYGYVIWGNTLANEQRLVYRTGFNLSGFVRQVPLAECPMEVRNVTVESPSGSSIVANRKGASQPIGPGSQLRLF
jgi:hypothetical protein